MMEDRWLWVTGGICIAAGAALLLLSWLTMGFGCADPGGCYTGYSIEVGASGMILVVLGVGLFAFAGWLRARRNSDARPMLYLLSANFVVALMVLLTVFNPLISPIDFIRDSDLDGWTDDRDYYPKDNDRTHPTVLQLYLSWANTSTNWTAIIEDVWVIWAGPEPTTDSLVLQVTKYASTSHPLDIEVGTLAELNNTWLEGVQFLDGEPYGLLSGNDAITLDSREYLQHTTVRIVDDYGWQVCWIDI